MFNPRTWDMITSPSRAQVRVEEVDHRSRPLRRQAVDPRMDRVEDLRNDSIFTLSGIAVGLTIREILVWVYA